MSKPSDDQRTLYYIWLSPFSRKVRVFLEEEKLAYKAVIEKPWQRRPDFMALNPACQVPILVDGAATVADSQAIVEYLHEQHGSSLMGQTPRQRAEVRRLIAWFDQKFQREVGEAIVDEKVFKRFFQWGEPNSKTMRLGAENLQYHLEYLTFLVERRNWLAGQSFSLADVTAAVHLSVLDYLGVVPWDMFPAVKEWYIRIKSRPSFRLIREERVPMIDPIEHYAELDF